MAEADRYKNTWIKEVTKNIGRKSKYLSPDVTVDHSLFESHINTSEIGHRKKKELCQDMTKQNMEDEPLHETDVTKYYVDFDKVPIPVPTKQERKSRLANNSHLSKDSRASKASSVTSRSIEKQSSV